LFFVFLARSVDFWEHLSTKPKGLFGIHLDFTRSACIKSLVYLRFYWSDEVGNQENLEEEVEAKKSGFFSRLKSGLAKTRNSLAGGIDNIVHGQAKVGPEFMQELEEVLITADVGIPTTNFILDELKKGVADARIRDREGIMANLKRLLVRILEEHQGNRRCFVEPTHVVLVVGVNGSGKTTTIGKLTQKWKDEDKKVLLGSGDTFRAAAV